MGMLAALNPVRLGLALLMISRPRRAEPAGVLDRRTDRVRARLLIPVLLLNFTPMFGHPSHASPSTGSALGKIQIGLGVVGLSVAAVLTVRFAARQRAAAPPPDDRASELSAAPGTTIAMPRLLTRAQDVSPATGRCCGGCSRGCTARGKAGRRGWPG